MAGSYAHCCKKTDDMGEVLSPEGFEFDTIENMGDAYEACHMMHWMIDFMATHRRRLIQSKLSYIKQVEECYYAYLREHGYD